MLIFCVNQLITDSAKNMYILVIVSITRVNLVALSTIYPRTKGNKRHETHKFLAEKTK